ncbi:MAG: hypothetical protein H6526_04910 [Actinobacteria bacterium]|nr:hypothetical protein [Actinomycetota bacterium]MCB8997255.1 hypothetical protein [Actinomycetota bacterium]MCB9414605.1 hypothetical protein [Actinomycetota bacterium]MCB9423567.1 hypothetical protein [Actinomycetota bacterium]HRY09017.1 hypothetical protein [Candidatus Nanopelagicales bacterium]
MRTEHDAYRAAHPKVGRAFIISMLLGFGLLMWALWDQSHDYYRRWPTEQVQLAIAYWIALGISWFYEMSQYDSHLPELRTFDASKLPVLDRSRRLPPIGPRMGMDDIDRRREVVLVAYGAFLSDIVQIANMPLLADPRCEVTDRFTEALVVAEDARAAATRDVSRLPAYRDAVGALEKAWRDATSFARRKGYATLAPEDQSAVRRAQRLLEIALDENAYAPERREAMRKAVDLLRSVVDVPAQAVTAIGHRVGRAQIPDGG